MPPLSDTKDSNESQVTLIYISRGREGARKGGEGEEEVKMCAFTWWHTVAGGTGGGGVRLG